MNPNAHRTLLPSEVRFGWPHSCDPLESFTAVRIWLDVLVWGTRTGRMELPYGSYLR
jgi:hypothetical protein